jgi:hypothetical protein
MSTKKMLFLENPYDVETLLECIKIATEHNRELVYMDRLVGMLRLDPEADLINLNYRIMHDLSLLKLEPVE